MERRQFLKTGAAAGLVGSTTLFEPLAKAEQINSASGTTQSESWARRASSFPLLALPESS